MLHEWWERLWNNLRSQQQAPLLPAGVAVDAGGYELPPELQAKYDQARAGAAPIVTDAEWEQMKLAVINDAYNATGDMMFIVIDRTLPEDAMEEPE